MQDNIPESKEGVAAYLLVRYIEGGGEGFSDKDKLLDLYTEFLEAVEGDREVDDDEDDDDDHNE